MSDDNKSILSDIRSKEIKAKKVYGNKDSSPNPTSSDSKVGAVTDNDRISKGIVDRRFNYSQSISFEPEEGYTNDLYYTLSDLFNRVGKQYGATFQEMIDNRYSLFSVPQKDTMNQLRRYRQSGQITYGVFKEFAVSLGEEPQVILYIDDKTFILNDTYDGVMSRITELNLTPNNEATINYNEETSILPEEGFSETYYMFADLLNVVGSLGKTFEDLISYRFKNFNIARNKTMNQLRRFKKDGQISYVTFKELCESFLGEIDIQYQVREVGVVKESVEDVDIIDDITPELLDELGIKSKE